MKRTNTLGDLCHDGDTTTKSLTIQNGKKKKKKKKKHFSSWPLSSPVSPLQQIHFERERERWGARLNTSHLPTFRGEDGS